MTENPEGTTYATVVLLKDTGQAQPDDPLPWRKGTEPQDTGVLPNSEARVRSLPFQRFYRTLDTQAQGITTPTMCSVVVLSPLL